MHQIKASFTDFDQFKQFAVGWELDFKLLSRNNFNAHLNLYSNDTFQLGRTSLGGTIHQNGLAPEGFRTIVFPAGTSVSYNWLHKDVDAKRLLIFPRDRTLESVSFDNFNVYVISVSEQRLHELIESYGFRGVEQAFSGKEKHLYLHPDFLDQFISHAEMFLQFSNNTHANMTGLDQYRLDSMISKLLFKVLKYVDRTYEVSQNDIVRKRDIALKKVLNYIVETPNKNLSIRDLCKTSNVSERTLEYAFLEKFKVSPSQYIKAYRLNMVKNELFKLKGQNVLISDTASKFGFYHMGQFSADFKRHFGINPSNIM